MAGLTAVFRVVEIKEFQASGVKALPLNFPINPSPALKASIDGLPPAAKADATISVPAAVLGLA